MMEENGPGVRIAAIANLPHPLDFGVQGGAALSGAVVTGSLDHLRFFPAAGSRLWQSRTSSQGAEWQYVNVRRLAIFIEQSLDIGLQWVVFENNGPPLWARVRQTIDSFLTTVWMSGQLQGSSRQEAFFVRCDAGTMTQNDIDSGRLVAIVGFAPVYPAEFVLLQISAFTKH